MALSKTVSVENDLAYFYFLGLTYLEMGPRILVENHLAERHLAYWHFAN
jgi:hypothetical protein